ncbi:MAG: acetyl ornithine aminotransferase family protein [Promethearchaeota archaeon]
MDLNAGVAVMAVGHGHPEVLQAIREQSERLLHYSATDFYYVPFVNLAENLTRITPGDFNKQVFLCNSGTEAIEAAFKCIRHHTRRPRMIAFVRGFHGRTLGSLSLTASKIQHRRGFFPLIPGVTHVPYPYCYRCVFKQEYPDCNFWCIDYIEEEVLNTFIPPDEVAAIVFEPIQGEGGYITPPPDYFKRLKKLADKHGILLLADEVQSGLGKTGKWFAVEHFGIVPDVVSTAKALASGLPIGAMIAKSELMDWEYGSHATTFGGNPISCHVANKVIEIIEKEHLMENATTQGDYIMKRFNELKEDLEIIGDVRGRGLMIGVELVRDRETKEPATDEAERIMLESWKNGLLLITAGLSTIRIVPPLIITRELIDTALEIIGREIKKISK